MSTFSSRTVRLLNMHFYPFNCEQAIIFTSLCLQFGISAFIFGCLSSTPLLVQAVFVYVHFPYVCVCVSAHVRGVFPPCCRLLERITSFKEYEIQHLLKSDTLWHCFEAMKVRLERHGSSFLSAELWVYVIALRPVKFPLKRHGPEGEDKAAT